MTFLILLLFAASSILAFIYLVGFCYRVNSTPKRWIKTTSILCLSLITFTLLGPITLSVGLLFCAIGDYFLAKDGDRNFLVGMIAFGIGHLCYCALFLMLFFNPTTDPILASTWGAIGLVTILTATMLLVLDRKTGTLKLPVRAYILVIFAMGICASLLMGDPYSRLTMAGAGLFIVSDTVLALDKFVVQNNPKFRKISAYFIWAFYWFAQVSILFGVSTNVKII